MFTKHKKIGLDTRHLNNLGDKIQNESDRIPNHTRNISTSSACATHPSANMSLVVHVHRGYNPAAVGSWVALEVDHEEGVNSRRATSIPQSVFATPKFRVSDPRINDATHTDLSYGVFLFLHARKNKKIRCDSQQPKKRNPNEDFH